jgi:hypothetical protein
MIHARLSLKKIEVFSPFAKELFSVALEAMRDVVV